MRSKKGGALRHAGRKRTGEGVGVAAMAVFAVQNNAR